MNTLLGKGAPTMRSDTSRPLPPKPRFMYGREREKASILTVLLNPSSPARVAILGAGGIGKTTLAISVLYDPSVIERYDSRFFVACDGVTSAELLLTELANVLRLPRNQLDENMHDLVLASFRRDSQEHVLLCFDNLETAWDNLATRRACR
ncbi:hypothetical protein FB45DRAFT_139169 [Roridomyces roridus]|uniref:NB-ARC domain-containing protein n=1 Tax=Roridomyces roridus TaxID=1738132 RepID=A0AAD7BHJ9_9AGAR|nr:hypothetical protein FB45DRAFT_139169 [Roridomyces roridus]